MQKSRQSRASSWSCRHNLPVPDMYLNSVRWRDVQRSGLAEQPAIRDTSLRSNLTSGTQRSFIPPAFHISSRRSSDVNGIGRAADPR